MLLKKRFRILTVSNMDRPTYLDGNYYFTDHINLDSAENDITPENTEYWDNEYEPLIIVPIYDSEN